MFSSSMRGWIIGSPLDEMLEYMFTLGWVDGLQFLPWVRGWVTGSPLGSMLD